MQRIYLKDTNFGDELLITDKELYHQITRVMRARVGQHYAFFDGKLCKDYIYEIVDINKSQCHFHLREVQENRAEPSVIMHVYQGLPNKFSKIETIVQKCCEVGYRSITFFQAINSQKLVISQSKQDRLEKIAIEAIEQCGGNIIPKIQFQDQIEDTSGEILVCHTSGNNSQNIGDIQPGKELSIIVGPEGGLHESELQYLVHLGARKVFFGSRTLRCETVAPVVGFYINQL